MQNNWFLLPLIYLCWICLLRSSPWRVSHVLQPLLQPGTDFRRTWCLLHYTDSNVWQEAILNLDRVCIVIWKEQNYCSSWCLTWNPMLLLSMAISLCIQGSMSCIAHACAQPILREHSPSMQNHPCVDCIMLLWLCNSHNHLPLPLTLHTGRSALNPITGSCQFKLINGLNEIAARYTS